jgi:hypothetical protein
LAVVIDGYLDQDLHASTHASTHLGPRLKRNLSVAYVHVNARH